MTSNERLFAVSPIDGRYQKYLSNLSEHASEHALIRYRTQVEIEWFLCLSHAQEFEYLPLLEAETSERCRSIYRSFTAADSARVKQIESQTNHDVKAIEYFIKEQFSQLNLEHHSELLHFGCTSEDINNLAYGLMLKDIRKIHLLPLMNSLATQLATLAKTWLKVPMLSRTHGQPASPSTVGKELANYVTRLDGWIADLSRVRIEGKMNGAVGNFNAHMAACPNVAWRQISNDFVANLGLTPNAMTTQIEPHDSVSRYLNSIAGFNQVMLDLDRDFWSYISIGYFGQKQVPTEVGSSTMPHKVNPIDFENSEGNIGIANALARHLADKLVVSRWQRDLSDSTALRNIGVVVAHTLIAIGSTVRGLNKLKLHPAKLESDLNESWEILGEAVQTTMRIYGLPNPYESVKNFTRGKHFDKHLYLELLVHLDLPKPVHDLLIDLTPSKYLGLAFELARDTLVERKKQHQDG